MASEMKQLQKEFYRSDAAHRYLSRVDQERLFRRWVRRVDKSAGPVSMVEKGLPALFEGLIALLCVAAFAVLLGADLIPLPGWTKWLPPAALASLILRMQFFARFRAVSEE